MIQTYELVAGRETDALVAERVMGLRQPDLIPRYSTDIAAAWTVVEKLGLIVGPHHLELLGKDADGWVACNQWAARDEWAGDQPGYIAALAETAPLAICRAALETI